MSIISINGKTFSVNGSNVSVINGVVKVDGKIIESGLSGEVHIKWEGDLASLECNTCDINGNVHGKVKCNTAEISGDVGGDVNGNTIKCENVAGSVKANTIKYRKKELEENRPLTL